MAADSSSAVNMSSISCLNQTYTNQTLVNSTFNNSTSCNSTDPAYEFIDYILVKASNVIDIFVSPVVCSISLTLNIICILIFMHPRIKSVIYKYLLFNSIFDSIILAITILRAMLKYETFGNFAIYNGFFELYFYVYLYQVSLTCSNFIKIW
jgi:hypothetical protein